MADDELTGDEPVPPALIGACPDCGGNHTSRQRCPAAPSPVAAPPPSLEVTPPAQRASVAPVYAPPGYAPPNEPYWWAQPTRPAIPVFEPRYSVRPFEQWPPPRREPPPLPVWRSLVQWTGGAAGSVALVVAIFGAAIMATSLPEAGVDVNNSITWLTIWIIVGLAACAVLYVAARVYAKVTFAMLSLFLVTCGLAMFVAAPVVRQMNTAGLAEYRGFSALVWCGALATSAGVGLGTLCMRWSMMPRARRRLSGWARRLGAAYGILVGVNGLFMAVLLFTLINGEATFTDEGDEFTVVQQAIAFTALALWALAPGVILTYHGISASMGEGSSEFRPPLGFFVFAAFAGIVALGQWNMQMDSPITAPMPILHGLAAALPGIALVCMVARGGLLRATPVRGLTWRQVMMAAAISMSVAVTIALYVESIGSLFGVVLLLVHNGAFETAANADDVFDIMGDADIILTRNEQFVASLFAASVLAPLSEEFGKGLGVRFMMRANSTRRQAFVLGAAAGAAFGFLEALIYGLGGIYNNLDGWAEIMLVRAGSTTTHVFDTAMVGLAWWYWSIGKRHKLAVGLASIAVLEHAAWNAFATILDSRIFGLDTLSEDVVRYLAYGMVGVVAPLLLGVLFFLSRLLRERPAPIEGAPLAGMAPWLG